MQENPGVSDGAHRPGFRAAFLAPRYWPTWAGLALLRASLWLPHRVRAWLGEGLGSLYHAINAKRRRIARINVGLCFPSWDEPRRRELVKQHFRTAARGFLDFPWWWWASDAALERRVRITGLAHYRDAVAAGHNVILLTYHNVALEAGVLISRHFPHVSMVKPLPNPVIDWLMTRARTRFHGRIFSRESGLRPLVRAVREGAGVYYIPDEDLGMEDSVFAPFFGVPAATLATLGRLSRLCNAVVIPCFARLLPAGRGYDLALSPPLEQFPTGDPEQDARRMNEILERAICEAPEQYWWTSKRFKHRPPGAPPFYD
ncbi:MAG: LpxL/LpxP family acyltransferase [Acidiferrobacteraceae bacterium]